jgi:uncharacterized protein
MASLAIELDPDDAPDHTMVVEHAAQLLDRHCRRAGIDQSHGLTHALAVLVHTDQALAAADAPLPAERAAAVRLAALLHDADDRKYFPETASTYANAAAIMAEAGAAQPVVDDAVRMISHVSCSANGNAVPPEAVDAPELLWPRWADRLEATGEIGVVRCYMYDAKSGRPLATEQTPRPATADEAFALATEERFAEYQRSGGGSASMMDHYYDKLLQVARPSPSAVRNAYLEEAALERATPLLDVCLAYGRTGQVPTAEIEAMGRRLGIVV